jgi:hypothetical protein
MKEEAMQESSRPRFHHRRNLNGTHDSICPDCYLTIASTVQEFELSEHESAHVCDPVQLYQISQYAHHLIRDFAQRAVEPARKGA